MDTPTYPEYAELRAEADRRRGSTVNPFDVHSRIPNLVHRRGHEWALAVLGREYWGPRYLYGSDMELLKLADERDLNPPLPQWVLDDRAAAEQREQERRDRIAALHQRDVDAWNTALAEAAGEVGALLSVYTNPHSRVRFGQSHDLAHAVPAADVYSGTRRIRTHRAGRALCETETRPRPLTLRSSPEPAGTPVTCERCKTWAPKVRLCR